MITEVATVTETILIYFFFVTKTMKRLVPKVLENTYHVYSYKVQLVYNYIERLLFAVLCQSIDLNCRLLVI